jgi:hypothetical protein
MGQLYIFIKQVVIILIYQIYQIFYVLLVSKNERYLL